MVPEDEDNLRLSGKAERPGVGASVPSAAGVAGGPDLAVALPGQGGGVYFSFMGKERKAYGNFEPGDNARRCVSFWAYFIFRLFPSTMYIEPASALTILLVSVRMRSKRTSMS